MVPSCGVQLKLSQASLEVQKQLAEQQREEAVATVTELEAQLAAIGSEIATHMQVRAVFRPAGTPSHAVWPDVCVDEPHMCRGSVHPPARRQVENLHKW